MSTVRSSTPLDLGADSVVDQGSPLSSKNAQISHASASSVGSIDPKLLSSLQPIADWSADEDQRPVSPAPEDTVNRAHFTDEEVEALKQYAQQALSGRKILTRTSTLSSMIGHHHEERDAQALMHKQMDLIYGNAVLTQYFHAFNVAMVALLDGSLVFQEVEGRVGVQIEQDTKYEIVTGAAGLIGGAVPGLEQLASVIEKVCGVLNKKDFGEANAKLSGLMEPNEIQVFVPSIARPLTLAMAGRLEKSAAGGGSGVKEFLKSTYHQLTHMQKRMSGTAGASASETAIIVMGFRHASKIAFAMADGERQDPPLQLPKQCTLREKIDLTLKWYCKHSNGKGNPTMTYDDGDLVVGVPVDYELKSGIHHHSKGSAQAGGASTQTAEQLAVIRTIQEDMYALRKELNEVKQRNAVLEERVAALESGTTTSEGQSVGTPGGAATSENIAEMRSALTRLQASVDQDRICQAKRTLTQAADIMGTFLSALPKSDLHEKVAETSDGLVRKDSFMGTRNVKQYLEQRYGSTHRDGTTSFTIEDDLRPCARKWVKTWSGALDDKLLNVARST